MIKYLIDNKKIKIFFQPIISIKDKRIFAYEALTRAYDENDELVYPLFLFDQARKENLSSTLDCHVRELAIIKFQEYYKNDKSLLLFLNFESSMINDQINDNFITVISKYDISPTNIVIEIKEDSVKDNYLLKKFVKKYKQFGFIIAIDDFGTGYSSFDRLALIKPDIVKIDRSIIYDIQNNFINSEILSAISNMCHKIGAMVLAEGVEDKNEILKCMKKDIDIFQGFHFSKAKNIIDNDTKREILSVINHIGDSYRTSVKEHISKKQKLLENAQYLTNQVLDIFTCKYLDCTKKLEDIIKETDKLEAIYILNTANGIQKGDTIIQSEEKKLYNPTKNGHDHSLKEYYFIAKESKRGDYLSGKYISKASGNMCRTYSSKIELNDLKYIVCFDIIV